MATHQLTSFAEQLRRYRRERGLTQEELAEQAGLSARGIRALEQGERSSPQRDTVRLLGEALRLSPEQRAAFERAASGAARGVTVEPATPIGGFLGAAPAGPIIARGTEMDRLRSLLEQVAGGEGRLVMLAGEPGVGKTRLAQEVVLHLQDRGFLIATGRCYEPEQSAAYYPFVEALATAYESAPSSVRGEVSSRWPYVEWLVPGRSTAIRVGEMTGQDIQQRLFWSVGQFLSAIAGIRPLAVLLDDLHWADESSLRLFQYLGRATRTHPIFLLGTYRDVDVDRRHPLERVIRDLNREGLLDEVLIKRLPREGTGALTAGMLGSADVSAPLIGLLHERTDGNPFFTQEVVRALMERGDLVVLEGLWQSRAEGDIEVPRSVRSAIGERLSRLTEPAQDVLLEASVLGQTFAFDDLNSIRDRSRDDVDDALDEALAASLIRVVDRERFTFSHALAQQTLYEELPARKRIRIHRLVAEALERLPEPARANRTAELAWHFLEAEESARALPYALLAGDQAEAVFGHAEAIQHYSTALELAGKSDDRRREAEALEKLGATLRYALDHDRALEVLARAAAAHEALGDAAGEARVMYHIGNVLYLQGRTAEALARIRVSAERMERLPESPPVQRALAGVYRAMTVPISFPTARYEEILAAGARVAELGQAIDDPLVVAEAAWMRGYGLSFVGAPAEARDYLQTVLPFFESTGDAFQEGQTRANIGRTYLHEGDVEQARRYMQQAHDLFEAMTDLPEIAWSLMYLGDVAFVTGEWAEARRRYERSADLARTSVPRYYSHALLHLAELSLLEGAAERGIENAGEGLAVAERCGEVAAIRKAQRLLAEQDLAWGDAERAVARLEPLLAGLGGETPHAFPPPVLAEAYLALGDQRRAVALVEEHIQRFRQQNRKRSLVLWLPTLGSVRAAQGRPDEARRAHEEAASLAHAFPHPLAEAGALRELGLIHRDGKNPELARKTLEEALALFRRLGARPTAEAVEGALRAL